MNPEWQMFSELEIRVIKAIGGGSLSAEEIAKATGENVSGRLRTILSNLVSRKVLTVERDGYSVNVAAGAEVDAAAE